MKRIIKKSDVSFIEGYEGFLYCKKALYYNDGEASYKITNILNQAKPFTKLNIPIQGFTQISFTSAWISQKYLDQGVSPDPITMNSIIIQPRKGAIRIWKEASTGIVYLGFLDVYNNAVFGRPTDLIAKIEPNRGAVWDGNLKFQLNFFSQDMTQGYAVHLLSGYINNESNFQNVGSVTYQGQTYNLPYTDVVISWCRIIDPGVDSVPLTWVVIDNGYTGTNWVPFPENSFTAAWNSSIMAERFKTKFINSAYHWDQVLAGNYASETLAILGETEINLGLGDIKFVLTSFDGGYAISFVSKNDLAARNYILNCKLSTNNYIKQFNLIYHANYTITFNSNAKLLINAFGDYASKIEIFIDTENKQLLFLSQKLF